MNRIDRVTAILIQLQSKKIVKAQDIAERFNISLRTVYRDIKTLEEAGVPVVGEAGVGYSIMDGYRLPPVMFTKEEATSFLMAEKLVESYTDPASSRMFQSAMFKIKAVLRATEQEFLEQLDESIKVVRGILHPVEPQEEHALQSILSAIHDSRAIRIQYRGSYANEVSERDIEPIGIFLQNSRWHLIAYCRLK